MADKTQHTPGPWKTNGTQIFKFDESKGEEFQDREIIANIYTAHQDNKEQREATAELIAKAPELLKENEQLKQELVNFQELYNHESKRRGETASKLDKFKTLNAELLEALKGLQYSFTHIEGNTKGNQAKTDIIKFNDDVKEALNKGRAAIAKAEGK